MQIGVRELKARLSAHLKRVQAGATVTITDRGRPIATLRPAEPVRDTARAAALIADGRARWTGGKPSGAVSRVKARGVLASAIVLEDRR